MTPARNEAAGRPYHSIGQIAPPETTNGSFPEVPPSGGIPRGTGQSGNGRPGKLDRVNGTRLDARSGRCRAPAVNAASEPAAPPSVSLLKGISAASHSGFDRLVFEFEGPVPAERDVSEVSEILADGSGLPVPVRGMSFLSIRFFPAAAHDDDGNVTAPLRMAPGLPNLVEVVRAGDFEGVVTVGVGLAAPAEYQVFTLESPSRVIVDIAVAFQTVTVQNWFLDLPRFATGTEPYLRAVPRAVIPPAVGGRVLDRLFAGPTPAEAAGGLSFVSSGATGYTGLTVSGGIARLRLTGPINSGGATFTVANHIIAVLKQFPTVQWVRISNEAGETQNPDGNQDSIPAELEP